MEIHVKICFIFVFYPSPGFQLQLYHIHWPYPCRSFKHSNWRRHKLSHA